jgi:hypothetical protein
MTWVWTRRDADGERRVLAVRERALPAPGGAIAPSAATASSGMGERQQQWIFAEREGTSWRTAGGPLLAPSSPTSS